MCVSTVISGDTVLAIFGSMQTKGEALTYQNGKTTLTGSFIHDASTHAFPVNESGKGISTGSIIFKDGLANPALLRQITSTNVSYDRGQRYIAFPTIEIGTNDTIEVPGIMGLDATKILATSASKTGKLYLRSDVVDAGNVEDASMRITGNSGNSDVPAGRVVIERNMTPYRVVRTAPDQDGSNRPLFAFASPMVDMRSGYFAGNWVRKLIADENEHVQYVYGNYADPNGLINKNQYITDPTESFQPGKGYLVKARPAGFDYNELITQTGLTITNDAPSLYDQIKFTFNGHVYTLPESDEQVFAADTLFSVEVDGSVEVEATRNYIIGNSWTSAISVDSLVELIDTHPSLYFEAAIYVWPSGATGYYKYVPTQWNALQPGTTPAIGLISDLETIPSQSLFMIRLLSDPEIKKYSSSLKQSGNFTLKKQDFQVHNGARHNTLLRSATEESSFVDEVLFRLSPESNPAFYDLAAVGLRDNSQTTFESQDMEKVYMSGSDGFLLYSLSSDNKKLSVNAVPRGTNSIKLCLEPGAGFDRMTLTASRTESIENVWLEDLLTHTYIDLKQETGYTFDISPQDTHERFVVHFDFDLPTEIEEITKDFLQCYYNGGNLVLKGLLESDLGSSIFITDISGRILEEEFISQTPEAHIPVGSLSDGIYLAKLQGKRSITVKFIKGGRL
jgi:hypothetical protein